MKKTALAVALFALLPFQSALAVDRIAVEAGYGVGTKMAQVATDWNWQKQWDMGRNWMLTGAWEADIGNWWNDRTTGRTLWEVGLTPVLRLNSKHSGFFWEAGIGIHYMSQDRIEDKRVFGNHFNFGDHVGFGWHLGDHGQYELGYRFQHLSNADTKMPNAGINFQQIRLGYNF